MIGLLHKEPEPLHNYHIYLLFVFFIIYVFIGYMFYKHFNSEHVSLGTCISFISERSFTHILIEQVTKNTNKTDKSMII